MQNSISKKYVYMFFSLLLLVYVSLLLGMIIKHYQEISFIPHVNIYDTIQHYNWKYWLEESNNSQTVLSIFVQFMDIQYFHSKGIISLIINISFMGILVILVSSMIQQLFSSGKKYNNFNRDVLIFSTVVIVFSVLQDSVTIWMFNQQLFAAYFFPLLSYYLLMKYSITTDNKYFYLMLLSSIMIIISTPYYLSALIVLLLMGFIFKISWFKRVLIFALIFLVFFLYPDDISNNLEFIYNINSNMAKQLFLYILNYLGSVFIYVSFEPCCATSSVLGGLFVIGTFLYFLYLVLSKKVTELLYWVILAFLLFYIFGAFASLTSINDFHLILFKNEYITPSLIAWLLIFILYIHHFHQQELIQKRVLTLFLTLVSVLFFYQVLSYQEFKKNTSKFKLAAMSLKLDIDDHNSLKSLSNYIHIMMYHPSNTSDEKMSIFTFNDIKNKVIKNRVNLLKETNPFTDKIVKNILVKQELILTNSINTLIGGIEKTIKMDKNIYQLTGWIYNVKQQKVPDWIMIFDEHLNLIGYIMTGDTRTDVATQYGNSALKSGFKGYIRYVNPPKKLIMIDELSGKVLKEKYLIE